MHYYLSYIDLTYKGIYHHTALMLSVQNHNSAPVEIIYELGFVHNLEFDLGRLSLINNYLSTYPGILIEEQNASKALYNENTIVAHRTYELSRTETEHFFRIINRDRRINVSEIRRKNRPGSVELTQSASGGPAYHKIKNNCKTYVLGVLKELGITEIRELSDLFIQRPGTHTALLKTLSDNELSCPIKEKLLEEITSALTQLNETMETLRKNIGNEASTRLGNYIQSILDLSNTLLKTREKVEIDPSFSEKFSKINSLLDIIDGYINLEDKNDLKQKIKGILKDTDTLINLYKTKELGFFWKQPPALAKRFVLTHFTPEEKALYVINVKTREISDRLQNIIYYLNQHIHSNRHRLGNCHLSQDLIDLKEITEEFKKRLNTQEQLFLSSTQESTSDQLIQQCVNQGERLNDILYNFDQAISDFTPRTRESSAVIKWIKIILSYINSGFFMVENAQSLIKAESASAKKENKTLDSKIKISNPDFFNSYCDIDRSESIIPAYTRSLS